MKKFLATLLVGMSLTMFAGVASAASAQPIKIQVNGSDLYSDSVPVIKNGRTLVPIRVISESLGADVEWDQATKTVTIIKNADTIKLIINQKATTKNGKSAQALEAPAEIIGGRTYVPVRFISEALGAQVEWDNGLRAVKIQFNEKRNDMSPMDLLMKSNAELVKKDTYHMDGTLTMDMKMNDPSGELPFDSLKMNYDLSGDVKTSTMQYYFEGAASLLGQEVAGAFYLDGNKVYIKQDGQEWVTTAQTMTEDDLDQIKELQKQLEDPAVAEQLYKELGIRTVFGNDEVIDGKEYYVVNVNCNINNYADFMNQFLGSDLSTIGGTSEQEAAEIQEMLENMNFKFTEKVYIAKDTLINDKAAIEGTMKMKVDDVKYTVDVNGNINITDLGKSITFPTIPADVKTVD